MIKSIPISPKLFLLSFLFLSLIIFSFPICYALEDEDIVDISQLPAKLAEALNAPLFAGQILASAIPFCLICFPTFLLTNESKAHVTSIIFVLGLCVALTWLPVWLLLLISLSIALMYANTIKEVFGK